MSDRQGSKDMSIKEIDSGRDRNGAPGNEQWSEARALAHSPTTKRLSDRRGPRLGGLVGRPHVEPWPLCTCMNLRVPCHNVEVSPVTGG